MRPRCLVFAAAVALLLGAAAPAAADGLLAKARAPAPPSAPLYTFQLDYDDGTNAFAMVVDQSKPMGARVVRQTPDAATLKGDAAKKAEMLKTRTAGDIWCNRMMQNVPATAKRISETDKAATFAFTPVPAESDGQIGAAFKYLNGTAVIDKASGAVLAFEMVAPKPFKPMAVAKVEAFQMTIACAAAPDGRTYIKALDLALNGSAMMQPFAQTERRKVSNMKAITAGP